MNINIFVELLGLVSIIILTFLSQFLFYVVPSDKSLSPLVNQLLLSQWPLAFYVIYRIYFGLLNYFYDKFPKKYNFGKNLVYFTLSKYLISYPLYI